MLCWCKEQCYNGARVLRLQKLSNVLDNAVKYSPDEGHISGTLTRSDRGVPVLAVTDRGPGIPVADRENVFRRFFRLESSRGLQPGNGLGLSLVQAVVNLHHGHVSLSDNHPGLRVEITLA